MAVSTRYIRPCHGCKLCGAMVGVDEVWIMVSRQNPLKSGMMPEADHHRMRMAELVANKCANVKASDFELSLPLPSYTYVTLCKLREAYPEHKFKLIIGSDNWLNLGRWRDADKIIKEFRACDLSASRLCHSIAAAKGVEVLSKGLCCPCVCLICARDGCFRRQHQLLCAGGGG